MENVQQTAEQAINQSISEDRIVNWVGGYSDLATAGRKLGYEVDARNFEETIDGNTYEISDTWGWTSETPEGEMSWRVYARELMD